MEHQSFAYIILLLFFMAGIQENGEPNSQATDSVPNGSPCSPESDVARQAFVSIDAEHDKQVKSSVLEVLKKVRWGIGWLFFFSLISQ